MVGDSFRDTSEVCISVGKVVKTRRTLDQVFGLRSPLNGATRYGGVGEILGIKLLQIG